MQKDRNVSDEEIKGHIQRLTGKNGPFELSRDGDEPPLFRRGHKNLQSLFNRVKMLDKRLQLRHVRDFSFGDVARRSSELCGPDLSESCYLGIRDNDPFTWMSEFMSAISNGNVAVLISGDHHVETFRHHTGQTLFLDGLTKKVADHDISGSRWPDSAYAAEAEQRSRRPAVALFTSGTTGLPKPVFHSPESVLSGLNNMLLAGSMSTFSGRLATPERIGAASLLLMCPLSYIAGAAQFFLSFLRGNSIVVPVDRSADSLASVIEQNQITSIVGIRRNELQQLIAVPTIQELATSVRTIHLYGETLPAEQVDELRNVLPNARIGQGYGMTEAFGPIAAFVGEDAEGPLFWKLPSVEAAVLNGSKLMSDGSGRLHIRGRNMMLGYAPPQVPAASFDWLDTGDEVELSSSGKMRILDRSSRVLQLDDAGRIYLAAIEKRALLARARDAAAWRSSRPGSPLVYLAVVPTPELKGDIASELASEFGVEIRMLNVSIIPRRHGGKIDANELARMQAALEEVCSK